jgi:uncharacterized protein
MSAARFRRHLSLALVALGLAVLAPAQAGVVISQVYGAGGNSGAPLSHDYVELFNRGAAPESLGGRSVQYASATGTGNFGATSSMLVALPNATLQPGQYFLVQMAGGANGAALPAPDATGSIAMAAGAGKVVVVEGISSLGCNGGSTPCSAEQTARIIDLVGYGGANFFEGSSPTGVLSAAAAALRNGAGCLDSNQNGADFTVAAPAPRNSASPLNVCGAAVLPRLSIDDVTLDEGNAGSITRFSFSVTLNTAAATDVSFDIATVDGSATVADNDYVARSVIGALIRAGDTRFEFDVEVIGDDIVEPNETFTVVLSNPEGAELQRATGTGTIRNDDAPPVAEVAISSIQGAGIGQSPWLGQTVATVGVVTALRSNGYFIQTAAGEDDGDDTTAEGLFVFSGNAGPPPQAVVGNRLRVTGNVTQFARTPHGYALTQLGFATASVLATGQPLPPVVELGPADLDPAAPVSRLGRYQGMQVALPPARVIGATNNFGDFFVTLADTPRPFREPGVAVLDAVPLPDGNAIPAFDMNPERLRVESVGLAGAVALNVDNDSVIDGLSGIMYYDRGDFTLLLPADPQFVIEGGVQPLPAPRRPEDALTIVGYNVEFLGGGAAVPVDRLRKLSAVFCEYLDTPDIVGMIEIADIATMQRVAAAINDNEFGDCPVDPGYEAYMLSTSGNQRLGFLVATREVRAGVPRIEVLGVAEEAANEPLIAPNGSPNNVLFDRPPLRITTRVNHVNGRSYPLTVINNHLLSLLDVNSLTTRTDSWGTAGNRSRGKRMQQAVRLGQIVEARQQADPDEAVVLIGDFNAFEFSDGYVDVMGILTGFPAPADEVLLWADTPLSRPLSNLALAVPQERRYSYVFGGSAQVLDHIVVNQALLDSATADLHYVRVNADFAYDNAGDPTVPVRSSDHDPALVHVTPAVFTLRDIDLGLAIAAPPLPIVSGRSGEFSLTVGNAGPDAARDVVLDVAIQAPADTVRIVSAAGWQCDLVAVADASRLQCAAEGPLPSGSDSGLVFSVTPPRSAPRTWLAVAATVASSGQDRDPANNVAEATARVTGQPGG